MRSDTKETIRLTRSKLGPGLVSRYPAAEVRRRLSRVDLVAVDIDECVFPGFSQVLLGYLIFLQISTRPRRPADLGLLPQMLSGGVYIRRVSLLRRLGRQTPNESLMERYERSMLDIPEDYFRAGARSIPGRSFGGALQALQILGRRAPLGLISFGVHVIAEQYARQLNREQPGCVSFVEANHIRFAPRGPGRRPRFAGYQRPLMTRPAHKLQLLEAQLSKFGARYPLVIGNGRDEVQMARHARQLGGLSVGFRPRPAEDFDLRITAADWQPLQGLLKRAFSRSSTTPQALRK